MPMTLTPQYLQLYEEYHKAVSDPANTQTASNIWKGLLARYVAWPVIRSLTRVMGPRWYFFLTDKYLCLCGVSLAA